MKLEDVVVDRPRLLLVGINPGLRSGAVGHHFAGNGNPFWRLLAAARLTPVLLDYEDDQRLAEFGIALTNLCPAHDANRRRADARRDRARACRAGTQDRTLAAGGRRFRRRQPVRDVLRHARQAAARARNRTSSRARACSSFRTRAASTRATPASPTSWSGSKLRAFTCRRDRRRPRAPGDAPRPGRSGLDARSSRPHASQVDVCGVAR